MKPYIIYPEGSYWVYEDSLTGHVDSFFLKNQEINILEDNNTPYKIENLKQIFDCNDDYVFPYNGDVLYGATFFNDDYSMSYYNFFDAVFVFTNITDSVRYMSGTYFKTLEEIPEMSFNGLYFQNIRKISDYIMDENDSIPEIYKISYWCKEIGMIKLEDYFYPVDDIHLNDTLIVRKLIKYNINK
jgi:hypothetical protein